MTALIASLDGWHQTYPPTHRDPRRCASGQLRCAGSAGATFHHPAFPEQNMRGEKKVKMPAQHALNKPAIQLLGARL
jgi:hypothetical protein